MSNVKTGEITRPAKRSEMIDVGGYSKNFPRPARNAVFSFGAYASPSLGAKPAFVFGVLAS